MAGATHRPIDPAPTFADVAYGVHERHRLDFFQAPGEGPRPLHVFFHGGGFSVGDKWGLRSDVIRAFHARGISVASCNYRLAQSGPLPQPLHDGVRAIQFLRSKAGEWKIDSQRVAAGGHSAGGLMALWLATHDDLANPASCRSYRPTVHPNHLRRHQRCPHQPRRHGGVRMVWCEVASGIPGYQRLFRHPITR